jgi:hypothetical protein
MNTKELNEANKILVKTINECWLKNADVKLELSNGSLGLYYKKEVGIFKILQYKATKKETYNYLTGLNDFNLIFLNLKGI